MGEVDRDALLRQRGFVRGLARRLVLDKDQADDVAQETLLAALQHSPRRKGALRAWLARIVRNLAYRSLRDDERRRRREAVRARPDRSGGAGDAVADLEMHKEVVDALLTLDEPYRSTLVLHFFEDLPPRAIAARLDVPGATVRTRLKRGLEKLRGVLDERHGGDRRAWCLALLPLAFPAKAASAAATTVGVVAMSTKSKLSLAAVLFVAFCVATYTLWSSATDRSPERRVAGSPDTGAKGGATADDESTDAQAPANAARKQLEVTVVDRMGTPLPGATLALYRQMHREYAGSNFGLQWFEWDWDAALGVEPAELQASTGPDGRALVDLPPDSTWHLEASKAGYARQKMTVMGPYPVTMRLGPAHALQGRVHDPRGRPVPGALVCMAPTIYAEGITMGFLPTHSVVADAEGSYRFDSLPAGDQSLWAAFPGGAPLYIATVRVPDVARFDITLARGGALEGKVIERGTGRPLAGAEVFARMDGPHHTTGRAVTNAQGRYVIDTLPPGAVVAVFARGPAGYALDGRDGVRLKDSLALPASHDIELVKAATLRGTVRAAEGPVKDVLIDAMCSLGPVVYATYQTRTDARGQYVIENLPPARYFVRATLRGYFHPSSTADLFRAFQPARTKDLLALEPGTAAVHDFEMRAGTAIVEGHVETEAGERVAGAKISVMGVGGVAGADGSFRIEGCMPGPRIYVSASAEGYQQSGFPQLKLEDGATVRGVVLKLHRVVPHSLAGRVRSADGTPLREPYLLVLKAYDRGDVPRGSRPERHTVAADGTFEIELRPEGRGQALSGILLQAGAVGLGLSERQAIVFKDERTRRHEVDLTLAPTPPVKGIVVGEDGKGVAGVAVSLHPPRPWSAQSQFNRLHAGSPVVAVTNADGLFEAGGLAAGKYLLHAWTRGHVDAFLDVAVPADDLVRVSMDSALALGGRVVTPDGKPVGRILLSIQRRRGPGSVSAEGGAKLAAYGRDIRIHNLWTNDRSEFVLEGLEAGMYRVTAGGYSGGPNVVRTVFEQVAAGSTELELTVERGLTIRGKVVDESGAGVPEVYMTSRTEKEMIGDTRRTATTAADGFFTITGLAPGLYTLSMTIHSDRGRRQIKHEHVAAGAKDVVISVQTTFRKITGRLLDGAGKPVGGVRLEAIAIDSQARFQRPQAVVDPAGRFELTGLHDGEYKLAVRDERHRDALLEGGDKVRAGARGLVLRLRTGETLTGVVRDTEGRPLERAWIEATDAAAARARTAMTKADGRFAITGLTPGVAVSLRVVRLEYATLLKSGVPSATTDLMLTLQRGLLTRGRVVDENGKALAKRWYMLFTPVDGDDTKAERRTDEQGRFETRGLLDREYRVHIYRPLDRGGMDRRDCGTIRGGATDVTLTARGR